MDGQCGRRSMRALSSPAISARGVAAALSLLFLLLYTLRTRSLEALAQNISSDLATCREQTESILARLQVMFEHRQLANELLLRERRNANEEKSDFQKRIQRCELESARIKKDLHNCKIDPAAFNAPKTTPQSSEHSSKLQLKDREIAQLKENVAQLEHVLQQKSDQLDALLREQATLKASLETCESKLSLQAAGHPKGPYYVQNETVHFARKHKADGNLEFDRDQIKFEAPKLVPAAELVEKLQQRKAQAALHPDDRKDDDDDAYVIERQNADEHDYKEHN